MMLTFEQLQPALLKWGRYYRNREFDTWDLIGAAWLGGRIRDLPDIKVASIAVRRAMIDYMRSRNSLRAKTRLQKVGNQTDLLVKNAVFPDYLYEITDFIDNLIKGFSREEKLIIKLRYFDGCSFAEIGKTIGITEAAVSLKHKSILRRLKAKLVNDQNYMRDTANSSSGQFQAVSISKV